MISPVYFKRGAYPYESTIGILLNVAAIYEASSREAFKYISGRSFRFPDDLLYFGRVPETFPSSRLGSLSDHVPSTYRHTGFPSRENRIRFCPDCLCFGYHSVFFCLPQATHCLVHGRKLENVCVTCQYKISDSEITFIACETCGFHWTCPVDQLNFRADGELVRRLNRVGVQQRVWFEFVASRADAGQSFFTMLDEVSSYHSTPALIALVTSFKCFPYGEDSSKRDRVLRCIQWDFATEADSEVGWLVACDHLVQTHLNYHEECLNIYNGYLSCWDGNALSREVCLVSLVYFLIRLRLSSLSLHHYRACHLDDLSFGYVRALEQSFIGYRFVPSELVRVYFLKLMFHLYSYLQAGYTIHIAMQPWNGVFYDLVARSVGADNKGETFLSIVPLDHRSCIQALSFERGLRAEQYRIRRLEDNYFTISRDDVTGDEVVSVFL